MSESSACKVDPESLTCWLGCLSTNPVHPETGHRKFTGSEEYLVSQRELPPVTLHAPMA